MAVWQKFQFFDREILGKEEKESKGDGKPPLSLFPSDHDIVCAASGRGFLFFGSSHGSCAVLDRNNSSQTFQAHDQSVIYIHRAKKVDYIVTVGYDNDLIKSSIKIWRIDQIENGGVPQLARVIKPFSKKYPEVPITCVSCLEDLSQIALGLGNGALMLLDGDLIRDRGRQITLLRKEGPVITGVHFVEGERNKSWLFAVSGSYVATFFTSNPRAVTMKVLEDSFGAELKCSTVTDQQMLAVARPHAVHFFQSLDLGPTYGFDELKKMIFWFNSYLVMVSEDRRMAKNVLTVYDLTNQFIAFSEPFDTIVDVVSEWSSLFVINSNGLIIKLTEKNLYSRISLLFRRSLFTIAINLAKTQKLEQRDIAEIFKEYGDHLYSKRDYDGAIQQYVKTMTMGKTYIEPSYVIRNFLDAQRIDNLTTYLEALHAHKCASKDHTTLLLNCFTKSKDVQKLDKFIRESSGDDDGHGPNYDIDTAINVCRQAQYLEHALQLSRKYEKHEWLLKILIEDLEDYDEAIRYIAELTPTLAEQYMKQYGQDLIQHNPESTTALLQAICSSSECAPEEFIHLFVGHHSKLQEFLEYVVDKTPDCAPVVYNTLLELYIRNVGKDKKDVVDEKSRIHPNNDKIMNLLITKQGKFDDRHAVVLTKIYKFEEGMIFLYKKLNLYNEILQYYMEQNASEKILNLCRQYQHEQRDLWVQALAYFTKMADTCQAEIKEVLAHIDEHNLLSPLIVVRMLAQNPKAPLGVVREYIIRKLQDETAVIEADEREIKRYQDETQKMRQDIIELSSSARTFQSSKCSICKNSLDLPTVHFFCMHSYHARCLMDSENECPICAPEYRKVLDIKEQMQKSVGDHETFNKLVHMEGFSAIAEYFGRGILYPPGENK